jgi:acetylornithine deacetylase
MDILRFDSTSGSENELAKYIAEKYKPENADVEIQKTESGRLNVFFKWGEPKIIFNSHLDTVPPYVPPIKKDEIILGRGSCDAKGQVSYLFEVCKLLSAEGYNNFGMLMTAGEEDGSHGAIRANETIKNCDYIIVGEPTENILIKASKGNWCLQFTFSGKNCHSGYPERGDNAISRMIRFINKLDAIDFGSDKILGKTTYNIGKLESNNAHNVVSDFVTLKMFFRTTFESHNKIIDALIMLLDDKSKMEILYSDDPMEFYTVDGFETGIVSYCTDAPSFSNIKNKLLYGPGSILVAHTNDEFIKIADLHKAVDDVKEIYKKLIN